MLYIVVVQRPISSHGLAHTRRNPLCFICGLCNQYTHNALRSWEGLSGQIIIGALCGNDSLIIDILSNLEQNHSPLTREHCKR